MVSHIGGTLFDGVDENEMIVIINDTISLTNKNSKPKEHNQMKQKESNREKNNRKIDEPIELQHT